MFGLEKFGNKNPKIKQETNSPDEGIDTEESPQTQENAGIDLSRRNFLRSGVIASAAVAGLSSIPEEVEAAPDMKLNFVGYSPTEHEKRLIMVRVKKVVPSAISVEIRLNDRSLQKDNLSSVDLSIITSDNKVYEGGGAGFYEKGYSISEMLNRALERLQEIK